MTLTRSDIVASTEDLERFSTGLQHLSVSAAWAGQRMPPRNSDEAIEPSSQAVGHVWRWTELRPHALRAAELVGTQQAERRVLQLRNPGITDRTSTTNTLFAGIQIVMPGEVARAHRHTMAALRFIIESDGGYTNVNGEPIPMRPGDLVLTPNWSWHDHANDTQAPMIWLDGLDAPLVRMLESVFQEEFADERQQLSVTRGLTRSKYGSGPLRPAWEDVTVEHSPLMHYPWTSTRQTLLELGGEAEGTPFDGIMLEYTNPATGGPVMPTMGCFIQMLKPGQRTEAHRHTASTVYHVVEGRGYSIVGGRSLDWDSKDVFCVPGWTSHQHVNASSTEPAFLFSYTDAPAMKALGLFREQPMPGEFG